MKDKVNKAIKHLDLRVVDNKKEVEFGQRKKKEQTR